ncbi:MAG TPA: ParB/RepB/Spo0J family partition protein [Candidatus Methylomirabilis sp.]|nr:ParB/RepB/Spo0J family partition protein [Candidatus Methylomirabilis sp.]
MSEVRQIPVGQIDEPLIPMREQFGDAPFNELVEDIGKNGITCPLKLRIVGDRFRVVFGHRRFKAAQVCALREVPAIVEEMDDYAEVRQMISENTGREEVSAAEQGRHYLALQEKFGLNLEQLAAMVGKTVAFVDERISFVQCDAEIADANVAGLVSWSVAKELLRVNPYTWALALRCDVAACDEATRGKINQHRAFLLDLCIRCGATGKVARNYVDQWKNSLLPPNAYAPNGNGQPVAPPAAALAPRCIVCGRDNDPGNMVDLKVHHWERAAVLKILRNAGMEVFE